MRKWRLDNVRHTEIEFRTLRGQVYEPSNLSGRAPPGCGR